MLYYVIYVSISWSSRIKIFTRKFACVLLILLVNALPLYVYCPLFTIQVIIYTALCVVSGFYYCAIICKNKEVISAHRSAQETQTIRQVATYPRFRQSKPGSKIQDLKTL